MPLGHDDASSLAALGKSGGVTVEVLSQADGRWSLAVDAPGWCVEFELTGSTTAGELAAFVRSHTCRTAFAELAVGTLGGMTVRVIKDDEFADRFFLCASGGGSVVEFTLVGGVAGDFIVALGDAAAEFAP